ncbi:MAG: exonuclease SbcCD subunit D C-terminal domain-containing protein [Thermoguttaceae bacterium]
MKTLHTSDWHLGHTLYEHRRDDDEFVPFLDWLLQVIEREQIELLVIAGDVFDTSTPPASAQRLYYDFLRRACATNIRGVVVTAGNHDSPHFLDAPAQLLQAMKISVVGNASVETEVIDFGDAIVGAVPFLRERDLRRSKVGETLEETSQKIVEGTRDHYSEVVARCEAVRGDRDVPIIVTGHLFVSGGQTSDGVRELYVGNQGQLRSDIFPAAIDYLALGHLHRPQRVGSDETRRYSGSPLAMSFDEGMQQKFVVEVTFDGRRAKVREVAVPTWRRLVSISGDLKSLTENLVACSGMNVLVEAEYTGDEAIIDLPKKLDDIVAAMNDAGRGISIIRVRNRRPFDAVLSQQVSSETLDHIDPAAMFARRLDAAKIEPPKRERLTAAHAEILTQVVNGEV